MRILPRDGRTRQLSRIAAWSLASALTVLVVVQLAWPTTRRLLVPWLPATGASSARLYWESFGDVDLPPIDVPTGCTIFAKEIFRMPRRLADRRFRDLRHWSEPDRGGHFAALERPDPIVEDLRTIFRALR